MLRTPNPRFVMSLYVDSKNLQRGSHVIASRILCTIKPLVTTQAACAWTVYAIAASIERHVKDR